MTITETTHLKPCPFCGGEYTQVRWIGFTHTHNGAFKAGYRGECVDCLATTGAFDTEEEAIEAWNTRAERTCKIRQAYFDSDEELSEIMEGIASSPEDTVACICESCGFDWRFDRGIRPNYCPNCGCPNGAKVVE